MNIGQTIKFSRIGLSLTQEEYAKCIGITPQTLSLIERGKLGVTNNIASKIFFSLNELLKDEKLFEILENFQINLINLTLKELSKYLSYLNSDLKNNLLKNKLNIKSESQINTIAKDTYKYMLCGNEFSIVKLGGELLNNYSLQKDTECLYFHDNNIIKKVIENEIEVDLGVIIASNDLVLLRANLLALKQIGVFDIIILMNQDNISNISEMKEIILNLVDEYELNLKELITGIMPNHTNNKNILEFLKTSHSICDLIVKDKREKVNKNKNILAKILK